MYYHLCKRQEFYHCVRETEVRERMIKLTPIHALVIRQIL